MFVYFNQDRYENNVIELDDDKIIQELDILKNYNVIDEDEYNHFIDRLNRCCDDVEDNSKFLQDIVKIQNDRGWHKEYDFSVLSFVKKQYYVATVDTIGGGNMRKGRVKHVVEAGRDSVGRYINKRKICGDLRVCCRVPKVHEYHFIDGDFDVVDCKKCRNILNGVDNDE